MSLRVSPRRLKTSSSFAAHVGLSKSRVFFLNGWSLPSFAASDEPGMKNTSNDGSVLIDVSAAFPVVSWEEVLCV